MSSCDVRQKRNGINLTIQISRLDKRQWKNYLII